MLTRNVDQAGGWRAIANTAQQITTLSSATALTVPANARVAVVVAETQAVRWKDDGNDPTASVGMPLATGVYFVFDGDLSALKFIEQTSGAKLNVSYYK